MERIIAATRNLDKIEEIKKIMEGLGLQVITEEAAGIFPLDVEETGDTFEKNSFLKAEAVMKSSGAVTIADDSGLEVDCLDGAPGVYSARFAGSNGDDCANNKKLIDLLRKVPKKERTGRFVSVITMMFPDGSRLVARGQVEGRLILEPRGENGFGYDPLFIPEGYRETFGQLPAELKNKISHRSKALEMLKELLDEKLQDR